MEYELNGASTGFWLRGVICLVSGLLALWSKQIAYTLPIMLCVLEIFLFHGRLINRKLFIAAGFLTVLAMSTAVFIWQEGPVNKLLSDLYSATLETTGITRSTYFLTQLRVVVSYMRLLFLPVGQSLSHFPPLYSSLFALPVMASLLVHLVLLLCGVVLFRLSARNLSSPDNWGRGVLQRMVSFGVVWFYVAMLVESSVIPIRDVMVEHRLYLPSAGFFMAVVSAVLLVVPDRSLSFKKLIIGFAMISLLLVGMTLLRNGVWETRESLWQDAVSKSPDNPLALSNLAGAYVALKQSEKAIPLYVRSMELKGDFQAFLLGEALQGLHRYGSRFTTGREYMRPGGPLGSGLLLDEDKAAYESTIYNTLGLSYEFLEEPGKAMKSYRMAVKLDPAYDLAWYNLGLLAARLGDTERVATAVKTLRTINPDLGAQLESTLKQ
jgi:tetratricopeptide (TPR) repeat protein